MGSNKAGKKTSFFCMTVFFFKKALLHCFYYVFLKNNTYIGYLMVSFNKLVNLYDIPYSLDQKPRLLIFSCRSRGGHYSRAATILSLSFHQNQTFYQHLYLYLVLHIPQPSIYKQHQKTSFLLGGSHLPKWYKTCVLLC